MMILRNIFGKSVKGKLDENVDLLKIIKQIDDVIIMNDEAHHINDEKQAWYKTIEGIHNNLGQRNLKLIMQLDYTATPKHEDHLFLFKQFAIIL